jgi:hypothetical protein
VGSTWRGWDLVLAMLLGSAIGMAVHMVLGFALGALIGMFQVMLAGSLIEPVRSGEDRG